MRIVVFFIYESSILLFWIFILNDLLALHETVGILKAEKKNISKFYWGLLLLVFVEKWVQEICD